MAGQGASRNGGLRLTLQAPTACGTAFARSGAALSRSCSSGSTGALFGAALLGRLQRYSCPAGLRQANSDGLLRRPGTVFTLTNVLDFLVNELACGGCRAFPGTKVCASLLYGSLLRNLESPPSAKLGRLDPARCACSHVCIMSFSRGKRPRAASSGFQRSPSFLTRSGTWPSRCWDFRSRGSCFGGRHGGPTFVARRPRRIAPATGS
jgi:hypothetical protein